MANPNTLSLEILGREYLVNCPPGAEEELRSAARHLHQKMQEIKDSSSHAGKVLSSDRIAVIAALNITHQLLSSEDQKSQLDVEMRVLGDRIDAMLNQESQLEL